MQGLAVFLSKFSEAFSKSCKKKEPNALSTFKAHAQPRCAFKIRSNNMRQNQLRIFASPRLKNLTNWHIDLDIVRALGNLKAAQSLTKPQEAHCVIKSPRMRASCSVNLYDWFIPTFQLARALLQTNQQQAQNQQLGI